MRIKLLATAGLAGALLMAGLAGCGSGSNDATSTETSAATAQAEPRALTWGAIGDITSWAVNDSEFGNRSVFFQAVYDGVLMSNPDGSLAPGIATEWSWDDTMTVLTMTIQDGLTFSDGTVLDAQAIADNLNRFSKGKSPDASNAASLKEAVALDPTTLQITLTQVDPAFIYYLARNLGLVQSPATFDTPEEKTYPVGSGPYVLDADKSVAGSTYVFTANPSYRDPANVAYSDLTISVIEDGTAMVNALKAGQVDVANVLLLDAVPELEGAGITITPVLLDWAGFSIVDRSGNLDSPLQDARVRQAINYAVDRDALLQGLANGRGQVRQQVFGESSKGYDESLNSFYTHDVEKAKQLMAEAGYANGFKLDMPKVAAAFGEAPFVLMADQLAQIGIEVNYTEVPLNDFFTDILTPKYAMYYMILERSPNDWQFINFLLAENAVWNPEHYTDETSAALIEQIRVATDDERPALLQQLNKHIVEQAWYVPFYAVEAAFGSQAGISVTPQAGNAIPYLFSVKPAA